MQKTIEPCTNECIEERSEEGNQKGLVLPRPELTIRLKNEKEYLKKFIPYSKKKINLLPKPNTVKDMFVIEQLYLNCTLGSKFIFYYLERHNSLNNFVFL